MSSSSTINTELLLSQALGGSQECLGRLLHVYRNYLRLLALSQLDRKVQSRVSPSDVVQETFLEANRDFADFRGASTKEFFSWLRQILVHNLHRVFAQHVMAGKRDVRREVSLEALASSLEQSTARLESLLPDPGTSPSGRIQQFEMEVMLADKLAELPPDYREVIVLRHIEALPFEQLAQRMDRSAGAARMLWLRAIRSLREKMQA